eukprot:15451809-Alexandrium_andersonii.AAC.1
MYHCAAEDQYVDMRGAKADHDQRTRGQARWRAQLERRAAAAELPATDRDGILRAFLSEHFHTTCVANCPGLLLTFSPLLGEALDFAALPDFLPCAASVDVPRQPLRPSGGPALAALLDDDTGDATAALEGDPGLPATATAHGAESALAVQQLPGGPAGAQAPRCCLKVVLSGSKEGGRRYTVPVMPGTGRRLRNTDI